MVIQSPRANSSYEGKRLKVNVEFTGQIFDEARSKTIYFEYTGNPDVSNLLPSRLLNSSVTSSFSVHLNQLFLRHNV